MRKILVLCHGNINRSALLGAALACRGVEVRSAGFINPGRRAAKKTREFAVAAGLSLEDHRSSVVSSQDVRWANQIVCMDQRNMRMLKEQFPNATKKAVCLNIPDPGFLPRGPKFEGIMRQVLRAAEDLCK